MIHQGDCVEVMRGMEADSVDAVVTDPPYGLEFMGKEWDRFDGGGKAWRRRKKETSDDPNKDWGVWNRTSARAPHQFVAGTPFQAWCQEWGTEALRVTKPGGYLLAFGGTRTHHRLVCGLEDAGWIIRDELDWIYASGFPKGKANLKPAHEPIVLARKPGPLRPLNIEETRIPGMMYDPEQYDPEQHRSSTSPHPMDWGKDNGGRLTDPASGRWPSNLLLSDPELFDEPNPWVVGSGATNGGGEFSQSGVRAERDNPVYGVPNTTRHSPDNYGDSGGYSRFFAIPRRGDESIPEVAEGDDGEGVGRAEREGSADGSGDSEPIEPYPRAFLIPKSSRSDREPVLRGQLPDQATTALVPAGGNVVLRCGECGRTHPNGYGGSVCARCGSENLATSPAAMDGTGRSQHPTRSNSHATVKPTDLMRHLIRLVTPPGGTVLDPFLGSGTTAIAAELEGFPWIGIEKEPEYVAIAEARLNGTQRGLGLDVGAPTKARTLGEGTYPKGRAYSKGESVPLGLGTDEEPAA